MNIKFKHIKTLIWKKIPELENMAYFDFKFISKFWVDWISVIQTFKSYKQSSVNLIRVRSLFRAEPLDDYKQVTSKALLIFSAGGFSLVNNQCYSWSKFPLMKPTLTWWGGLSNKEVSTNASTRSACRNDATTFEQNKRIFLSTLPKTEFNTKVCSYFSLS